MLSRTALCISLASIFLGGQTFTFNTPSEFPLVDHDVHPKVLKHEDGLVRSLGSAPPHLGGAIPQDERQTWNVDCTSVLTKHECENVIDGSNFTFWQTTADAESVEFLPHSITIDLREIRNVNAISMRPLPDADLGGAIAGHKIFLSVDEITWDLVAFGTWFEDERGELTIISQTV